ncbi:hypothetical protein EVAR_32121_1 [Eumeta japonica]|uniref:Uncharacterized protein n=1 Tax=Eumeta variegata TaxID=151549 RepID=A0A4C1V481_EUMVA|nr:hypothetical protein EVAR_32121_1 [Eumeta japonica]
MAMHMIRYPAEMRGWELKPFALAQYRWWAKGEAGVEEVCGGAGDWRRTEPTKALSEDCKTFHKALQSIADDEAQTLGHHDDGSAEDDAIREKDKLKIETYLSVLYVLYAELLRRLEAYREINSVFGFLTDFTRKINEEKKACTKFCERFSQDIEPEFINEMMQFKYFILQLKFAAIAVKDKVVPV